LPADAELSRHDPDVPDWDDLPVDVRRLYARMMEVFAGFLSHTDHHLGRILDYLRETDQEENTLIMLVSDNGASSEGGVTGTPNEMQFFNNAPEPVEDSLRSIDSLGGPTTFNHYAWGWTFAGNTPFRRWKRETYRGGVSAPFVVHWPRGIKARGEVRTQYAHLIDIVPTVLDLQGIEPPASIRGVTQAPLHGVSFRYSFDDAAAPTRRRTQYYEMLGHRAIDHDGWRAVCPWPGPSFSEAGKSFGVPISAEDLADLDAHHWELYHLDEDPTENHNIAEQHRDKLIELIALWYVEAGRYNVLPIDGSGVERVTTQRPQVAEPRALYVFRPGTQSVPFFSGPRVLNRPHSITADVEISSPGANDGVLLSQGSGVGGWSMYLSEGRLHFAHNYVGRAVYRVIAPEQVPAGRHQLRLEFEPTGEPDFPKGRGVPGRAQLYVDGTLVAQEDFPITIPIMINPGPLVCGYNHGSPVSPDYQTPFRFTGVLHTVTVDLSGELITDSEAEMRMAMARQ
jgi:arylsulfatase